MMKNNGDKPPLLSDFGERKIIENLISAFPSKSIIPPGDDCGAVEFDDRLLLLSIDAKSEASHFPDGFTGFDMGWSIVAANLSDIAAMGGAPIGFLMAYGLPRDTPFSALRNIQEGISLCLSEYSVPLIGADTKENECITLTGASVGIVEKDKVLLRGSSVPGDLVCVTGSLGGSQLGLRSLRDNLGIISAEERFKKPYPRIKEGTLLSQSGFAISCIDISDGLSSSLYEFMKASGNGFEIDPGRIPLHESLSNYGRGVEERQNIALHSGDEYELLFTVSPDGINSLKALFSRDPGAGFEMIGIVTEKKEITIKTESGFEILPDSGYEHFK